MAIEECGSSINRNYLLEPLQAKETSSGNSAVQRGGHRKTKSLPSKHSWDLLSKPEYESCFADGSILNEGRLTLQILQDGENQMNRNQMDMGDSEDHVGEAARIRIISNRHQRSCKGHKRSSSQHDMLRLRKQRPCDGSDVKFNKQLSYKKGNRKLCIIERWNTAAYAGHSLNARYFDTKCFQSHKFHFKSKVQHGRLLLCGRKI
ncbi:hypothetical protein O6H91_13G066600 [Diphasiastrum complanatum]|uniref:Uncharacterized protein n=1 Tax=Diphasiastrum complanatum TaxID=34168 RepID=A0ACC2BVP7_DIPCM|nr:hypothetical protein O6H91_13G066600 [Diphasiastrum complanatum]